MLGSLTSCNSGSFIHPSNVSRSLRQCSVSCPPTPLQLTYLPPPWGECESKALESGFFQVYSVTACRIDCETRYIVENCNCRMVHMPGQDCCVVAIVVVIVV